MPRMLAVEAEACLGDGGRVEGCGGFENGFGGRGFAGDGAGGHRDVGNIVGIHRGVGNFFGGRGNVRDIRGSSCRKDKQVRGVRFLKGAGRVGAGPVVGVVRNVGAFRVTVIGEVC